MDCIVFLAMEKLSRTKVKGKVHEVSTLHAFRWGTI